MVEIYLAIGNEVNKSVTVDVAEIQKKENPCNHVSKKTYNLNFKNDDETE